jgi:predicted kinase
MGRKVMLLMGLPGSGKTTFANSYAKENWMAKVISLDDYRNMSTKSLSDLLKHVFYKVPIYDRVEKTIIIDGLFLTNEDLVEALRVISDEYPKGVDVEIHYWKEDRETCLKNDGGRRELPSSQTIQKAKYEQPNLELLNSKKESFPTITNISTKEHCVILKPNWNVYFNNYTKVKSNGILKSSEWCTGGMMGNCWDDTMVPYDPDEPNDFEELDSLLEQTCPQLTFLQYKKIWRECVTLEENRQSEYYGGYSTYMHYECKLEKLYNLLDEFGYVTNNE